MSLSENKEKKITVQNPNNLSDYAWVFGTKAAGALAMSLTWDDGVLTSVVAGCQGMIMGAFLLAIGLTLIGQPPAVFKRIRNGEPIDY